MILKVYKLEKFLEFFGECIIFVTREIDFYKSVISMLFHHNLCVNCLNYCLRCIII